MPGALLLALPLSGIVLECIVKSHSCKQELVRAPSLCLAIRWLYAVVQVCLVINVADCALRNISVKDHIKAASSHSML